MGVILKADIGKNWNAWTSKCREFRVCWVQLVVSSRQILTKWEFRKHIPPASIPFCSRAFLIKYFNTGTVAWWPSRLHNIYNIQTDTWILRNWENMFRGKYLKILIKYYWYFLKPRACVMCIAVCRFDEKIKLQETKLTSLLQTECSLVSITGSTTPLKVWWIQTRRTSLFPDLLLTEEECNIVETMNDLQPSVV